MSSSGNLGPTKCLSLEQKRQLYRDGYIVLKGAVSKELTQAARRRIKQAKKNENLGSAPEILDLVNESTVTPILHEALGFFDPVSLAQVGVIPPRKPGENFTPVGYKDKNVPYYGANTHMDGIATIMSGIPQDPSEVMGMTPEEKYQYHINSGIAPNGGGKLNEGKAPGALPGKPEPGRSCLVLGENGGVPFFNDPACTLGIGSFSAFVFVALNDQLEEGCGSTAVLPGSHHFAEKFYQWQREVGGPGGILGVEGPGWPRLNCEAENGLGLNYLPEPILAEFTDESKYGPLERSPDGRPWPRPTQVLMEEGDACITVYHVAHTGTRNEKGTESRKNIIFRIRAKAHNPNVVVSGVTDHPDRGQWGQWLDPEKDYNHLENPVETSKTSAKDWIDPFERSKHLLCHPWEIWQGMQEIVAEERANEEDPVREFLPLETETPKKALRARL